MSLHLIREAIQPRLRIFVRKYKQILWDKIKDMPEVAGFNVAKIKQDLLYESESSMIITGNNKYRI
jgi:hypothetical protein